MEDFNFAGWGQSKRIENLHKDPIKQIKEKMGHSEKLGQWQATAICGNDITSSCLYVSALSLLVAGAYAPIALLLVAVILYLFRKIYGEVGSAIPLNGGTYTLLLNTTNKKMAAIAACLTILSYIATAVISASEAMHYAHHLWHDINITLATITLLGFFAFLNLIGITESAKVALAIFIFHIFTLILLSASASYFVIMDPSILTSNWQNPLPNSSISVGKALFLGFAAAMLGISGFESSANFIEEQKEGVFPKTLRNMWLAVAIFNPLICFLALGMIDLSQVGEYKTSLLATMGERSFGGSLRTLISVDAVLVLSGAVLTSFVGVVGLVRRMALDSCLPQFFLKENNWRKTNHWIILAFFGLCCLILIITTGEVTQLAGVYTISFLCVMALYSIGNMLLKSKRDRLPRVERASWPAVSIALIAILIGLAGNLSPSHMQIFMDFFLSIIFVVGLMLFRLEILRVIFYILKSIMKVLERISHRSSRYILDKIHLINSQKVIYFSKADDLANLNKAALYVIQNEHSNNLIVAHVYKSDDEDLSKMAEHLKTVDQLYPQLKIDFLAVKGEFGPSLIEKLSNRLKIPKNFMFISTPSHNFKHTFDSLGGVRIII
jgi:amino acid transporter